MDRQACAELGHFLRTRRERLTPDAVGFPAGPRRRTTGLRREEVAALAHLSVSWYTHLEQGRPIRPSVEVLDNLARTLRLDRAEHRYLHALAAGPAPSVHPLPVPDPEALSVVRALVGASDDMPYPAYAVDAGGNFLACNAHMPEWYADFSGATGRDNNMAWWLITSPEARERIAGWHDDARDFTARTRYVMGTNAIHPSARDLVRAMRAASPEFRGWWDAHEVVDQEARNRTFHHPRLGLRSLRLAVVRPAVNPAVSIVFHVPAG